MFLNFIWSLINSSSSTIISMAAIIVISRNISPTDFFELSNLSLVSAFFNIFIDFGNGQKCHLKKKISEKTFLFIEKNMLSRVIISFTLMLIFCIYNEYFIKYNFLLITLFLFDGFILYLSFRPSFLFSRFKLFKLKTKYSILSSLLGSIFAIVLTFLFNGRIGYVSLLLINPIILCILLRNHLKIKLPSFKAIFSFNSSSLFQTQFLFQISEQLEELLRRFILLRVFNTDLVGIYLRNETFLYSPLKILNTAIGRVLLATWGPVENLKNKKINYFIFIIVLCSLGITILYSFVGSNISNIILGKVWNMNPLLFFLLSILVGEKFLSLQLSNVLKIKTKKFDFILIVSLISLLIPFLLVYITNSFTLINILTIYVFTLLLKNLILFIPIIYNMNLLKK